MLDVGGGIGRTSQGGQVTQQHNIQLLHERQREAFVGALQIKNDEEPRFGSADDSHNFDTKDFYKEKEMIEKEIITLKKLVSAEKNSKLKEEYDSLLNNKRLDLYRLLGKVSDGPLEPVYTANDLYGPNGPRPQDIEQGGIGDCAYLASLAGYVRKHPETITRAISHDPRTGAFTVKLHDQKTGDPVNVVVTQRDVIEIMLRPGGNGSTVDNRGVGPIWPAVMEAAKAKQKDPDPADGLPEGYEIMTFGDVPGNDMKVISGDDSEVIWANDALDRESGPTELLKRLNPLYEPPLKLKNIVEALNNGRPVVFGTGSDQNPRDGLFPGHAYSVEGISRNAQGQWVVKLRNPHGRNGTGEGVSNENSPVITITMRTAIEVSGYFTFATG